MRDVKLRKALEGVLSEGGGSIDDLMAKLAPGDETKEKKEKYPTLSRKHNQIHLLLQPYPRIPFLKELIFQ